jgi:lipopolysaccharide transport system ATP-binding protein
MSEIAVRCEGIGKRYRLGRRERYRALRDVLTSAVTAPLRRLRARGKSDGNDSVDATFWALKDISFEVEQGEALGIIGRNGAGKSTLLKILSRITRPTLGCAYIEGRVGSLLEVGTGFHPELTGRENIYLNGAILGMRRAEIARKFDEIVEFAEVSKFIDTPVKHYSSGMYVRLAFGVAAHLEPEILIVDEVLAVGDAKFQKKCLGKMGDVAKAGRTVLLVSHNMTAVQSLCRSALWLDAGQIVDQGAAAQVVARYMKESYSSLTEQTWEDIETAPGNDRVRLRAARVRAADSSPSGAITIRTPFVIEFEYWNLEPDAVLNLSLVVYNEENTAVFNTGPLLEPVWNGRPFPVGLFKSACYVPGDLLNDGAYRVELYVVKDQTVAIYRHDGILFFDVRDALEMRGAWHGKIIGAVRPNLRWTTELVESEKSLPASIR